MNVSPMLNYDPKKDKINPKRCQICVQRLEEKKSDVIFPNLNGSLHVECRSNMIQTRTLDNLNENGQLSILSLGDGRSSAFNCFLY